jgi:hypothetical protein
MFCLTVRRARRNRRRKDELFEALRGGMASRVWRPSTANCSRVVKEQTTENGDALPEFLDGLVTVSKSTVGVRKAVR